MAFADYNFILFVCLTMVSFWYSGLGNLVDACGDVDEPLMLTPLLDKNLTDEARRLSVVDKTFLEDFVPQSHAGYFTVNHSLGSHMFFWFFPAAPKPPAKPPLVVWLNGGPTVSSMLGLFHEHGPMDLDPVATKARPKYQQRHWSWAKHFSMLYVDNPIGAGFSHSRKDDGGDPLSEERVSRNLHSVLEQFLRVFPEYRDVDLYIGGQSYAGMYVISLAHYIHSRVELGNNDVHLTGIYLGGPLFDPENQMTQYANFHHHFGAITKKANLKYNAMMGKFPRIKRHLLDRTTIYKDVIETLIQFRPDNNLATQSPVPYEIVGSLMNTPDIRRAVHAGKTTTFNTDDLRVTSEKVTPDPLTSRIDKLAVLMNEYKTLIFNGNLDSLIPTASIEASLFKTPWRFQQEYLDASRHVLQEWDKKLAYYTRVGQFCRVIINGAGHITPADSPKLMVRVMKDFVLHGCIQ